MKTCLIKANTYWFNELKNSIERFYGNYFEIEIYSPRDCSWNYSLLSPPSCSIDTIFPKEYTYALLSFVTIRDRSIFLLVTSMSHWLSCCSTSELTLEDEDEYSTWKWWYDRSKIKQYKERCGYIMEYTVIEVSYDAWGGGLWRHDLWLASICDCGTICDHRMLQFVTRHDLWPKVLQFVTSVIQWF